MKIIIFIMGLFSTMLSLLSACRGPTQFERDWLLGLPTFDEIALEPQFEHQYIVIVHIDHMTCSTCANFHLKRIAGWYQRFHSNLGFVTVVHDFDPIYLRNLRRVTGFRNPIAIADVDELGIGFFVAVFDNRHQEIRDRLVVDINASTSLDNFEQQLAHLAESSKPN